MEARRAGINETLLTTPGAARRLREEMKGDISFTGGALNPIAEKAKRLNADFHQISQHLKTIGEFVSGSLQDSFSDLLETVDGWLVAHKGDIIWFSNKAAEISVMIADKSKEIFTKYARLTAELWNQYEITQKIHATLKGIGEVLQSFWDGSITGKINSALEWAFQPFKWLWDKLQSIGLVGPAGASTPEASGGISDGTADGSRRSLLGPNKGIGAAPTSAQAKATEKESWDFWKAQGLSDAGAAVMVATEQGESNFNPRSFGDADTGGAHGSFQWHMDRVNKILAATGIDVRTASHLDQLKAAKWEGEHGDTQARRAWQAVLHATSAADATRAMTYLFERPLNKARDTYTRQGYANRILREHGAGSTNPLANLHMPAADFHKALETIRSAKPLAPWQQSMNEHHDHRVLNSNVEVKVAGTFPIDKTEQCSYCQVPSSQRRA